jgi:hypothetical protein
LTPHCRSATAVTTASTRAMRWAAAERISRAGAAIQAGCSYAAGQSKALDPDVHIGACSCSGTITTTGLSYCGRGCGATEAPRGAATHRPFKY